MDLTPEARRQIEFVASETLDQFEKVATAAKRKLRDALVTGPNVLASVNTMTSGSAIQQLGKIDDANRKSYQILASEPALARVVVADEKGEQRTYYICRTMPVSCIDS